MAPKQRVTYFYDNEFADFCFGQNHPMKPHRLAMTHQLVLGYGLHKHMDVYRPRKAFPSELAQFHSADYVHFLSRVHPGNADQHELQMRVHNFDDDCPVFDGLFDFCRLYAGASLQAAAQLNNGLADIAINWSGGLHHAKKSQASGFCYINDLVLAILELLRYHARVLYVDIDIHHGDGVEEAFYTTDRVLTVSFHKYGDYFFPGTGDVKDVGEQNGRYYSINVPLQNGLTDATFLALFKPIMKSTIETFMPEAIVMQCGADSLAHDRLGCFNLSTYGHGEAVRYLKAFGLPMLVTGGGGYTKHNVARCWTYETALLTDQVLPNELPDTDYHEYFAPDFCLNVAAARVMEDSNNKAYVEKIKVEVLENLRHLAHAPGVAMQEMPPKLPEYEVEGGNEDAGGGPIERWGKYMREHRIIDDNELYDGDHDHFGD